ncbi:carbohydrate sulfotransferase 1-like [Mytilus galloprovincialis]|uniref:carbohydrate sulfotransferase 1-like n=1 Tax=Mytilus galloprovincialis TaxID=29158 RepID=UPI003F7C2A32
MKIYFAVGVMSVLILVFLSYRHQNIYVKDLYYVTEKQLINTRSMVQQKNITSASTDILLFGYMKGETTFVGNIVGCRANVFYFYEPLWSLSIGGYFTKDKECGFHENNCKSYNSISLNIPKLLSSLYDCYTETIEKLTTEVQTKITCTSSGSTSTAFKERNISKLATICTSAKLRVTKVLRIGADLIEGLIHIRPNLKIIYLYRDPRAIIRSRTKRLKGSITAMTKAVCGKMDTDSRIILELTNKYSENIIFVSAERIAKDPIGVSQKLFDFLGLNFSKALENKIINLSYRGSRYNSQKKSRVLTENSGFLKSMKWRTLLSIGDKKIIDNSCQSVYRRLGYHEMSSEESFRNIYISNIVPIDERTSTWL